MSQPVTSLVDYGFDSDEEPSQVAPTSANQSHCGGNTIKLPSFQSSIESSCESTDNLPPSSFQKKLQKQDDSEKNHVDLSSSIQAPHSPNSIIPFIASQPRKSSLNEDNLMPPVPASKPNPLILEQIKKLRALKKKNTTVNRNIEQWLEFKNPCLLEKIMKVFAIDPYCSNYPKNVFDLSELTQTGISFESVLHPYKKYPKPSTIQDKRANDVDQGKGNVPMKSNRFSFMWDSMTSQIEPSPATHDSGNVCPQIISEAVKTIQGRLANAGKTTTSIDIRAPLSKSIDKRTAATTVIHGPSVNRSPKITSTNRPNLYSPHNLKSRRDRRLYKNSHSR